MLFGSDNTLCLTAASFTSVENGHSLHWGNYMNLDIELCVYFGANKGNFHLYPGLSPSVSSSFLSVYILNQCGQSISVIFSTASGALVVVVV